jgi:hypothetical protein
LVSLVHVRANAGGPGQDLRPASPAKQSLAIELQIDSFPTGFHRGKPIELSLRQWRDGNAERIPGEIRLDALEAAEGADFAKSMYLHNPVKKPKQERMPVQTGEGHRDKFILGPYLGPAGDKRVSFPVSLLSFPCRNADFRNTCYDPRRLKHLLICEYRRVVQPLNIAEQTEYRGIG